MNDDGLYTFRYHQDMGLGSFMGVDGPEFRPGNTWGHVETAGTTLPAGEHEWEVLVRPQPRSYRSQATVPGSKLGCPMLSHF